jgi:hypothetical protein
MMIWSARSSLSLDHFISSYDPGRAIMAEIKPILDEFGVIFDAKKIFQMKIIVLNF